MFILLLHISLFKLQVFIYLLKCMWHIFIFFLGKNKHIPGAQGDFQLLVGAIENTFYSITLKKQMHYADATTQIYVLMGHPLCFKYHGSIYVLGL